MAEDVQREVITEMLNDADKPFILANQFQEIRQLGDQIDFLGLRYFAGYHVVSQPSGSGVHIVYH